MNNFRIEGNQITFLDSRMYYTDGHFVPSVTTYLNAYPKGQEYYAWLKKVGEDSDQIRDDAGKRGSNVHKMIENYNNGLQVTLLSERGSLEWSLSEWAMFTRYVEFRNRYNFDIMGCEMQVIDIDLNEAGTIDLYIKLNGKNLIVDVKTSNAIYDSYWLQLAAYRRLFEKTSGEKVDAVGILWLNAKTRTDGSKGAIQGKGWQLILKEDSTDDIKLFDCTKELWRHQNKNIIPNNVSYQLSHQYTT
jgi:hypothetical protein